MAGWAAGAGFRLVAGVTAAGPAGVVTFGEEGGAPVTREKYSRQLGSTRAGVPPEVLEQVEGEEVVAPEIAHQGVEDGVGERLGHDAVESI